MAARVSLIVSHFRDGLKVAAGSSCSFREPEVISRLRQALGVLLGGWIMILRSGDARHPGSAKLPVQAL